MSWREVETAVSEGMTAELAACVRSLRVGPQGTTWRGVATDIFDTDVSPLVAAWADLRGNQAPGMFLCEAAASFLGENPNKEPWN